MSASDYTPQDIQRFWSKVDTSGGMFACWLWNSYGLPRGYGMFRYKNFQRLAHRVSYELAYGAIPDGLQICHRCDNPSCVNPTHLFLGTQQENITDMFQKGRDNHVGSPGEKNGRAILNEDQVHALRERYAQGGITQQEIAREFGISRSAANYIITRKNWGHLP